MKRYMILPAIFLLIGIIACGSTNDSSQGSSRPAESKMGWLCDFDSTGRIRLWTAASMDATVKDVVGTCVGCCVDVTLIDDALENGILFYHISVGGQSGWVDVEYYYPRKPSWSNN